VLWRRRAVVEVCAVVADQRGRYPRLLAPANLEAERESSREIVAREAGVRTHVPELAVRPDLHQRKPDISDQAARVGDHQVPVPSEDAHELGERRRQVGHMAQRDRADDHIDGVVGERQVMQVCLVELALGHRLASAGEHLGRHVDADHLVSERRQVRGVATGTAGGVERDAERETVEDLAHDRLFQIKQLIPRLVVERSPTGVAFARRHRTRLDPFAQLFSGVQECLDLAEASDREVPVIHAGERPEQGDAFQAEQIRQRVLVDHGSVDPGITEAAS
jgi:hypothetical protein